MEDIDPVTLLLREIDNLDIPWQDKYVLLRNAMAVVSYLLEMKDDTVGVSK